MKLAALTLAVLAAACSTEKKAEKDKPRATPASRPAPPAKQPPALPPAEPPAPSASVTDATARLVAALQPIADHIEEALMHGCMEGADRVAKLYDDASDSADDLHVMLRDPALRSQLQAAIHARQDRPLAKVLSKIDTNLVGCDQVAQQAQKGMDRLLQPAIAVPQ